VRAGGARGLGYKNLSGGIVAVHRATRPERTRGEQ